MKQNTSVLFSTPEFIWLLMDLNITKTGFLHLYMFMTQQGIEYTAAMGRIIPRPIPKGQAILDMWKNMAKPLELRPPLTVADPPASGRSCVSALMGPLHSIASTTSGQH